MSIRFRFGVLIGFGVGYYLGAKAGNERYKQIRSQIERARRSDLVDKAKAGVDLAVERIREAREHNGAAVPAGGGGDEVRLD